MGHVIFKEGIIVDPKKVKINLIWLVTRDVVDIRSFVNIIGYYQIFIEGFSKLSYPITSQHKRRVKVISTEKCQENFYRLKYLLTLVPILKIFDPGNDYIFCIGASPEGLGGLLMQDNHVIACESIKLKDHENNYAIYDLELFVLIHALKMWHHYFLGKKFTLITDHNRF